MSEQETYNGWTNRETWAVALHINNDQGWQESVREAVRQAVADKRAAGEEDPLWHSEAGDIIRENVEETLAPDDSDDFYGCRFTDGQWGAIQDIGSLWRVDWTELGASFLEDIEESDDEEPPYFGEELHDDAEDE